MNSRYSYGGSKIISELLAINYGRRDFDRVMIFRPHNVYGPDMGWEHVIPQLALRAKKLVEVGLEEKKVFPVLGSGNQTRAFIHIDDFTGGLMKVIAKGQHHNIYHIGNDEEINIKTLASKILECFNIDAEIISNDAPEGETTRRCPNVNKLRSLGYEQKVSLEKGLQQVVNWYSKNAHLKP